MERTVKLIRVNHPEETMMVTPAAAQYIDKRKWMLAEPQPEQTKKKGVESAVIKRVVPSNVTEIPVVIPETVQSSLDANDPKEILRAKYKELTGEDPDGRWNEGRLNIEISKLKVNA
jgi:hypothetical protein